MAKQRSKKFGLAAASVAGLMAAVPATAIHTAAAGDSRTETLKQGDDDCPQGASAVGSLRTIVGANTDYNTSPKGPVAKKKAAKKKAAKKAARKKAVKKATKKTARKRALKRPMRKSGRMAAKRRNPC